VVWYFSAVVMHFMWCCAQSQLSYATVLHVGGPSDCSALLARVEIDRNSPLSEAQTTVDLFSTRAVLLDAAKSLGGAAELALWV
jgi:hypothetical protein